MPVEIRELTIKVQVDEQAGNSQPSGNAGGQGSGDNSAVVKEAVEEVMRILESKKER
jgi:hypothetical protein